MIYDASTLGLRHVAKYEDFYAGCLPDEAALANAHIFAFRMALKVRGAMEAA